jgi:hypothetical protein
MRGMMGADSAIAPAPLPMSTEEAATHGDYSSAEHTQASALIEKASEP